MSTPNRHGDTTPGTTPDAAPETTTSRDEVLLTLHLDRLDHTEGWDRHTHIGIDPKNSAIEPHWYLGFAIRDDIITWNTGRWNEPTFGIDFTDATQHEVEFSIRYDFPGNTGVLHVVAGDSTDYPDDIDELTIDQVQALPSTLTPDPPTIENWLTYIVAELNTLHAGTAALVQSWPR
ncbi:hypothetical protein [Rhodococcoides fascians]|uniref:hypothetical protein n=1 Tax=Rhodococcoides fascians TaxID=1828 RepID=UPI0012FDC49B|nr:hypothetical protein [Rhodococcus fascians]